MQPESVTVTLSYPGGAEAAFTGHGAVVYASDAKNRRMFAVTGLLTLGDAAQLMSELMDAFGPEDITLALSLALVARKMNGLDGE